MPSRRAPGRPPAHDQRASWPRNSGRDVGAAGASVAEVHAQHGDGARLEQALRSAGDEVERRVHDGVTHEFLGMAAVVDEARDAQAYAGERLRQAFGR